MFMLMFAHWPPLFSSFSLIVLSSAEVAVDFTDDAKRRPSIEKRQSSPDINAPIYGELVVLGYVYTTAPPMA